MPSLINQLFINCMIIIACVTFANMLLRDHIYRPTRRNKILTGMLSGILSIILMLNSVEVSSDIILDFRFIPVVLMAVYMSPVSVMVTTLIICLFRITFFGLNHISIISAIITIIIGAGCGLIGRTKWSVRARWLSCMAVIVVGSALGLAIVFPSADHPVQVITIYLACMIAVFVLMFIFIEFIRRSNSDYFTLKDETEKDFLTGLYNVRYFDKAISQSIDRSASEPKHVSLLFIDIDHFKKINDQYGHADGDLVLKELGSILRKMARNKDILARNGGEEFTVLLADCGLEQAAVVGERIRHAVESHDFRISANRKIKVTISIGISSFPATSPDEIELVRHADQALYKAKCSGRNQIQSFENE